MSIPFFVPPVCYVSALKLRAPLTLSRLCTLAGVQCRATGAWTERQVELVDGAELKLLAEPGCCGKVRIEIPKAQRLLGARIALAALAYGLQDLVARESIRNAAWMRVAPPRGRPRTGRALSSKERQRRFRRRKSGVSSTSITKKENIPPSDSASQSSLKTERILTKRLPLKPSTKTGEDQSLRIMLSNARFERLYKT